MSSMERDTKIGFRVMLSTAVFALRAQWDMSKSVFAAHVIGAVFEALIPLLQAYIAGSLVGELAAIPAGNGNQERLIFLIVVAAATQLVSQLFGSLKNYYLSVKREYLEMSLNDKLLQAQTALPLETLELAETQDKYNYAEQGMREISWFTSSLMSLMSGVISVAGILIVVFTTVPWATIALVPLPIFSVFLKFRNYKTYRSMWDKTRPHRMRSYRINGMLTNESGILEVRLYGLLEKLLKMWRKESKLSIETRMKDESRNAITGLLIDIFESVIGLAVDIWLVFQVVGLTIGVGLFEQTRRLVSNYILSLSRIGNAASDIALSGYKVNDYRTYVSAAPEKSVGDKVGVPTSVALTDVTFAYPNASEAALDAVTLHLTAGETVALVGENGAGKTTLLKVLLGVYTAQEGDVTYNNRSIDAYANESIYAHIAPLFQQFQYYDFLTIGRSVTITGTTDKKRLESVLKLVGMWDYIQKQPKKLDANIGCIEDDGIKLSGGQWQRLAIARALYKDAPVLILDEPTSAIDAKSEQEIMDAIFDTYADRMLIAVSHRLSTVSRADRIVVIKDGRIVEDGTHDSLWKKGTAYHTLFQKQATKAASD